MRTGSQWNPPGNYLIRRLDSNDPAVMESRYEKRGSQAAAENPGIGRAKTRGVCGIVATPFATKEPAATLPFRFAAPASFWRIGFQRSPKRPAL
jgi:hypothetical protein